jgi:hypothetical protein
VLDNLDRLCTPCHRRKTHHGWALVTGTGPRPLVPPTTPATPPTAAHRRQRRPNRPRTHATRSRDRRRRAVGRVVPGVGVSRGRRGSGGGSRRPRG